MKDTIYEYTCPLTGSRMTKSNEELRSIVKVNADNVKILAAVQNAMRRPVAATGTGGKKFDLQSAMQKTCPVTKYEPHLWGDHNECNCRWVAEGVRIAHTQPYKLDKVHAKSPVFKGADGMLVRAALISGPDEAVYNHIVWSVALSGVARSPRFSVKWTTDAEMADTHRFRYKERNAADALSDEQVLSYTAMNAGLLVIRAGVAQWTYGNEWDGVTEPVFLRMTKPDTYTWVWVSPDWKVPSILQSLPHYTVRG